MAVYASPFTVVARRAAVETKLEGGVGRWFLLAPNQVVCADPKLCCAGFMHPDDATAFLELLEGEGLEGERGGAYQEVAIMASKGPWRHDCRWLDRGPYAGVEALWLRGSDPEPLVVPVHHRPSSTLLEFSPEEAGERLEFLRSEGEVDVYWDKQLQRELYTGRTARRPDPDDASEQAFQAVVGKLKGMLSFDINPVALGWLQRRRLRKHLRELERLTELCAEPWRVWFYLGLGRRSLPDPEGAWQAFRAAYHQNPNQRDVGREYAGQCLTLGRGDEAVALGRRNCERYPEDAGLRSNLALALMIAGDMEAARAEVRRARAMEPEDRVTAALETMIDQVIRGDRPRPERYP